MTLNYEEVCMYNVEEIEKIKRSLSEIDVQISDYESRLRGLRHDREGTMTLLVEMLTPKTPIIEVQ
jgi:hypothetical protein